MERFDVPVGGTVLAGERRPGEGPPVVLLHAGVADRRVWHAMLEHLDGPVIAYDRRGFGETPPPSEPFTHVEDLLAVLDAAGAASAWLVGNSMGGAVALDAALTAPERVAGLVLIGTAVSGEPDEDGLDAPTQRLVDALQAADGIGETARLEAWLWLDGPAADEGRVGGAARELALAMNTIALGYEAEGEAAGGAGIDAWARLEEITAPATVAWGELDVPVVIETSRAVARRIPGARAVPIPGVAHLPSLERPEELAALVQASTSGR